LTKPKLCRLSVLLTTRDRNILTQKTIESLHVNSSMFDEINIYVFDNLSEPCLERFKIFSNLLKLGRIKYYSYDTSTSLNDCFGKAVVFRRWIDMMNIEAMIRRNKGLGMNLENYYALIDNDILVGPEWDKYFVPANQMIDKKEPQIHFIVKSPGGVPTGARERAVFYDYKNANGLQCKVLTANAGGGSGFWFMNFKQLQQLKWNDSDLLHTYKQFKRHDTTTWNMIKSKLGGKNYVAAVIPPEDNPLIIHLGGLGIGSICNNLQHPKGPQQYLNVKSQMESKDREFTKMNANQIFDKFKNSNAVTNW